MPPKKRKGGRGGTSAAKRTKTSAKPKLDKEESASAGSSSEEALAEPTDTVQMPPCSANTWKITSWNVNGVRAWLQKKGLDYLKKEKPDVMAIQETKCGAAAIPQEAKNFPGYHTYWESTDSKEGYAGVGLFSKEKPLDVKFGMGIKKHDDEGRLVTAEYEDFYLIGAYVPNSGRGLVRLKYRQEWNKDFLKYITQLDSKKPVIYTGDLNVAHKEIDLKNPKTNTKTAGFTKEEREDFTELLNAGFVDSFRHLYPKKTEAYSFWSYMNNARAKNIGWRLDYFVLSQRLIGKLRDSIIQEKVQGSDHCPICLFIDF